MYCRIADDKDKKLGVSLIGTYFGGIAGSEDAADQLAQTCVEQSCGGMVIPKVTPLLDNNLFDSMEKLNDLFNKMVARMQENDQIMSNTRYYKR